MTWLPVCMKVMAGSWLMASVCMLRMKHMSSTILAVCGNSSLTHMPHLPCWANLNFDGAMGNRVCPLVMVVSRWPLRTESGRSLSYQRVHLRLVVVEVDLRRAADHVQIDDVLGLAAGSANRERASRRRRRQRHRGRRSSAAMPPPHRRACGRSGRGIGGGKGSRLSWASLSVLEFTFAVIIADSKAGRTREVHGSVADLRDAFAIFYHCCTSALSSEVLAK